RVAAVFHELARLGFQLPKQEGKSGKRILELGAGFGAGAMGAALNESFAPIGIPKNAEWLLLDQERSVVEVGEKFMRQLHAHLGFPDWQVRSLTQNIGVADGKYGPVLLTEGTPQADVLISSYFLNELKEFTPEKMR